MVYTVHGIFQARVLELVALPFPRGSSQPRMEPRSPALQVGSLPVEPQGKPKNTAVGNISLLQKTFLTQEFNHGLLHSRHILYQLKYQGVPITSSHVQQIFLGRNSVYKHTFFHTMSRGFFLTLSRGFFLLVTLTTDGSLPNSRSSSIHDMLTFSLLYVSAT